MDNILGFVRLAKPSMKPLLHCLSRPGGRTDSRAAFFLFSYGGCVLCVDFELMQSPRPGSWRTNQLIIINLNTKISL
jgi:hypothetical protein